MTTPRKVRSDIRTLANHIDHVREALLKRADIKTAHVGKECKRTSDALAKLLSEQKLPDHYKVAVVGRFKAGKSSFVNELLEARLASEDTNPETAAVTTFRHGTEVKATIQFLSREDWTRIQGLYEQEPKHVDAHRVLKWHELGKPRKNKDGEVEETFDLPALERTYVREGGYSIEISLGHDKTKKAETEFRRRLKEFTTGSKPHHCLVRGINIETPAPILDGGVLLIDTPGLGDTERYRVELTEEVVEDVDAVLFLTRSGASYDQHDKDFLLSLLRKGTVKQLIVVVTQVDVTYLQHLDNAEASDEEPEPIEERIDLERRRLTKELADTLAELSLEDSPAMRHYREQLGEVQIAFTSAKLHRDAKAGKSVPCLLEASDPGGVEGLKSHLLYMLSTESRLAIVAQGIAAGARTVLLDLQSVLDTKLLALQDNRDRDEVEQKLRSFRDEFGKACERFERMVTGQVTLLAQRFVDCKRHEGALLDNIALLAERELSAFEVNDMGRHWRTRRSGTWGHMAGFQNRVANRIFPKVQEMLGTYTDVFADFATAFETHLNTLSAEGVRIASSTELGASLPFDVTAKLKDSLQKSVTRASDLIAATELEVNKLLEDFVDDEVSERIDEAREKVSDILGAGTTRNQSAEVQAFYHEVKRLLTEALQTYLAENAQTFGEYLVAEAEAAPRDALAEVALLLEQADDNLRTLATAQLAEQKVATEELVAAIKLENEEVLSRASLLLDSTEPGVPQGLHPTVLPAEPLLVQVTSVNTPAVSLEPRPAVAAGAPSVGPAPAPAPAQAPASQHEELDSGTARAGGEGAPAALPEPDGDWAEEVRDQAQITLARIRLLNGEKGWSYERLFPAQYLAGAVRVRLIDAYLSAPHQLRNLGEFLLHLAESARPKEVELLTTFAAPDQVTEQNRKVDALARELFHDYGVTLTLRRDSDVHDRFLVLDHGVLFKLGRGLDFYKPTTGLGRHRPDVREVRTTEIDVFCLSGHALAQAAAAK